MGLSNHVTYEGRLECAHPSVAVATLKLKMEEIENDIPDNMQWLINVFNPRTSVVFLNTSEVRIFHVFNEFTINCPMPVATMALKILQSEEN